MGGPVFALRASAVAKAMADKTPWQARRHGERGVCGVQRQHVSHASRPSAMLRAFGCAGLSILVKPVPRRRRIYRAASGSGSESVSVSNTKFCFEPEPDSDTDSECSATAGQTPPAHVFRSDAGGGDLCREHCRELRPLLLWQWPARAPQLMRGWGDPSSLFELRRAKRGDAEISVGRAIADRGTTPPESPTCGATDYSPQCIPTRLAAREELGVG